MCTKLHIFNWKKNSQLKNFTLTPWAAWATNISCANYVIIFVGAKISPHPSSPSIAVKIFHIFNDRALRQFINFDPIKHDFVILVQKFELGHIYTSINLVHFMVVVRRRRRKQDYVGKIPRWRTPPPPPVWETPVIKKKVGFIFHFRTSGTFLVFTKKSPFWVID